MLQLYIGLHTRYPGIELFDNDNDELNFKCYHVCFSDLKEISSASYEPIENRLVSNFRHFLVMSDDNRLMQ